MTAPKIKTIHFIVGLSDGEDYNLWPQHINALNAADAAQEFAEAAIDNGSVSADDLDYYDIWVAPAAAFEKFTVRTGVRVESKGFAS